GELGHGSTGAAPFVAALERDVIDQRRGDPRHLLGFGGARDADAGAAARLLQSDRRDAKLAQQLGHEDAVLATAFVDDLAETGGRHHQRVGGRHDRGEAGWRAAEPALEGIAARRIDDDELHGAAIELAQYGLDADAVARNIPLAPDLRIDRNHVVVP